MFEPTTRTYFGLTCCLTTFFHGCPHTVSVCAHMGVFRETGSVLFCWTAGGWRLVFSTQHWLLEKMWQQLIWECKPDSQTSCKQNKDNIFIVWLYQRCWEMGPGTTGNAPKTPVWKIQQVNRLIGSSLRISHSQARRFTTLLTCDCIEEIHTLAEDYLTSQFVQKWLCFCLYFVHHPNASGKKYF